MWDSCVAERPVGGARDDDGMSLEDVKEESLALAIAAAAEARAVFAKLVLPTWGTGRHGWPRTLYGHVMGGFSLLDGFRSSPSPTPAKHREWSSSLCGLGDDVPECLLSRSTA